MTAPGQFVAMEGRATKHVIYHILMLARHESFQLQLAIMNYDIKLLHSVLAVYRGHSYPKYSALYLDISQYLLSKELKKDTPYLARKGEVWGAFRKFIIWKRFEISPFRVVLTVVLYSIAIYRDSVELIKDAP